MKLLMTRASGSEASYNASTNTWATAYPLSSVNTANMAGALKYVLTETIDYDTGVTNTTDDGCSRKNGVQYIHFYEFTICNPDNALWWFNYREGGSWNDSASYNEGEYGKYVTFDSGKCHGSPYCRTFHGDSGAPKLGPFVGFQDVSTDDRNPTVGAYWYSLPGECPEEEWGSTKTDECIAEEPSGRCEDGTEPDGETCTWAYEMMGQVNLDDLVGITALTNPNTGTTYSNFSEYCLDGNKEFVRNNDTFEFVSGLDFWKDPKTEVGNTKRYDELLVKYADGADNKPLPSVATYKTSNPRCYTSCPDCFESNAETCERDDSMYCAPCPTGGCAAVPSDASSLAFPATLSEVAVPNNGIKDVNPDDPNVINTPGHAVHSVQITITTLMVTGLAMFLTC